MARKTSKTAHVLNLLAGSTEKLNPAIVDAGKATTRGDKNDRQDIISQLVGECVPEVLGRFNCCQCNECIEGYVSEVARGIEPGFAPDALSADADTQMIKNKYRQEVSGRVIKAVIANKKAPKHSAK